MSLVHITLQWLPGELFIQAMVDFGFVQIFYVECKIDQKAG